MRDNRPPRSPASKQQLDADWVSVIPRRQLRVIGPFAAELSATLIASPESSDKRNEAISLTLWRICAWTRTLDAVASTEHVHAVAAGARAMFELNLDIRVLHRDPDGRAAERFGYFPLVAQARWSRNIVESAGQRPDPRIGVIVEAHRSRLDERMSARNIETRVQELWGASKRSQWPKHWSGMSVATRAERFLQPERSHRYRTDYPLVSWFVHAGPEAYSGNPTLLPAVLAASLGLANESFIDSLAVANDVLLIEEQITDYATRVGQLQALSVAKAMAAEQGGRHPG